MRLRLEREQPLTFLEFNYMILQAYDFRELYRRHGVRLQMGGSDQWGNIVCGIELVRRTDQAEVFGLTTPLITTASGAKMGKTARGRGVADRRSREPLRILAVLAQHRGCRCRPVPAPVHRPAAGRDRAAGGAGRGGDQRGEEDSRDRGDGARAWRAAADEAAATAQTTFEAGEAAAALPSVTVSRAALEAGIPAFRLFAEAGLAASGGDARRLIRGGGARLNDVPVEDEALPVTLADLHDGVLKLSAGRKQHRLVRPHPGPLPQAGEGDHACLPLPLAGEGRGEG